MAQAIKSKKKVSKAMGEILKAPKKAEKAVKGCCKVNGIHIGILKMHLLQQ